MNKKSTGLSVIYMVTALLMLSSNIVWANCEVNNAIVHSTPDVRFDDSANDGTVSDLKTGLMWQKCSVGQSGTACTQQTLPVSFTWDKALQAVASLNANGGFAGYTDWRLPNRIELASLIEEACLAGTSINTSIFPVTFLDDYWSSTPASILGIQAEAWYVNFSNAHSSRKKRTESAYIRLVR